METATTRLNLDSKGLKRTKMKNYFEIFISPPSIFGVLYCIKNIQLLEKQSCNNFIFEIKRHKTGLHLRSRVQRTTSWSVAKELLKVNRIFSLISFLIACSNYCFFLGRTTNKKKTKFIQFRNFALFLYPLLQFIIKYKNYLQTKTSGDYITTTTPRRTPKGGISLIAI